MAQINFSVLVPTRATLTRPQPPPGIIIVDRQARTQFSQEGLSLLTVTIEFSLAVGAGVVATWLYDTFVKPSPTDSARQIKINEKVVTVVTADQLQQLIEREITETKGNAPSE